MIVNEYSFETIGKLNEKWKSLTGLLAHYEKAIHRAEEFNWMQNVNVIMPYSDATPIVTLQKDELVQLLEGRLVKVKKEMTICKAELKEFIERHSL